MADRQDQAERSATTRERERADRFQRFGVLRRAQPADATMKNLLELLTVKLELCERLPVWEWEAGDEGNETCAATFHAVLETERRTLRRGALVAARAYRARQQERPVSRILIFAGRPRRGFDRHDRKEDVA